MASITYPSSSFLNLPFDLQHSIVHESVRKFAPFEEVQKVKYLFNLTRINKSFGEIAKKIQADCLNSNELNLKEIFSDKVLNLSKNKESIEKRKMQFFKCVKSLAHRLENIDISFLSNCSDKDIATIFKYQKGLKSFAFDRSGISNEIISKLVNLEHLKIKLRDAKSSNLFKFSDEVIEFIVAQNPNLKTLHLDDRNSVASNITKRSVPALRKLSLKNLTLCGSKLEDKEIEDLLAAYPKLKKLKLVNVPIRNKTLKTISKLKELTNLHIDKYDLYDFSHLSHLQNLEVLKIKEMNDDVKINFDFLMAMPNLKKISWQTISNFISPPILQKLGENNVEVENRQIQAIYYPNGC